MWAVNILLAQQGSGRGPLRFRACESHHDPGLTGIHGMASRAPQRHSVEVPSTETLAYTELSLTE